jgi:GMP synthase-like glutamine amidotransferase
MKLYFFQHVPYESPGFILEWAKERGHFCHFVHFYENCTLPEINLIEALVVLGGPMNIYDVEKYSWLEPEKDFVKNFIRSGKKVLGICLGSQMIANSLGAKVIKNDHTEIGWFKVMVDQDRMPKQFTDIFPDEFITFHWHGDTFDIPEMAIGFISSEATPNQAFIHKNVAAFQFHPEMTKEGVAMLVEHNEEVFEKEYPFIQSRMKLMDTVTYFEINKNFLYKFLDKFFGKE